MDAKLKGKWLDALRSGKFKQGAGELVGRDQHQTTYCCLGVLCKVTGMDNVRLFQKDTLDSVGRQHLLGPWSSGPNDDHFSSSKPETQTTVQRQLAAMNDNGCTFAEIAAWIEANVPAESQASGSGEQHD